MALESHSDSQVSKLSENGQSMTLGSFFDFSVTGIHACCLTFIVWE
jgi:hypothetical protein